MSITDRSEAAEVIGGSVKFDGANLYVPMGDRALVLTLAEGEAMARELRYAVFLHAPEMVRVLGPNVGDDDEAFTPDEAAAALAEGRDVAHGLQCPHERCGRIGWEGDDDAVFIVDEDERWSRASYERTAKPDGTVTEVVHAGGSDSDHQGLGYRCVVCYRPVTLPAGVEEEWI